jgi:putative transposase
MTRQSLLTASATRARIGDALAFVLFFLLRTCYKVTMPRKARIDATGAFHHIIIRGIEGRKIFRDELDRDNFLGRLAHLIISTQTRCFAWALLPNHSHLLLQTGSIPIAGFMRRLLTGYAVSFNLKYHRQGHLFQNRYKSILCQEDLYLKELVRYIHLNPYRAALVLGLSALDTYPWCGHSAVIGNVKREWQSTEYVLGFFGKTKAKAQKTYRAFIEQGMAQGKRPELVGGGLIRSMGGWVHVVEMRRANVFIKSDERILGDGDFVERVLREAEDRLDRRYLAKAQGLDFEKIVRRVAAAMSIEPSEVLSRTKSPQSVQARSLLCFLLNRDVGMSKVDIARKLRICHSAVSRGVLRGEKIALENTYR